LISFFKNIGSQRSSPYTASFTQKKEKPNNKTPGILIASQGVIPVRFAISLGCVSC